MVKYVKFKLKLDLVELKLVKKGLRYRLDSLCSQQPQSNYYKCLDTNEILKNPKRAGPTA